MNLPGIKNYNRNESGLPTLTLQGPVTALYNALSKEGKEKRRVEAFKQENAKTKIIVGKYNIEVVKQVTQLNDDGARRFMEWCRFEDDFILRSTEYEMAVAMLKCLDEFPKADTVEK